MRTDSQLVSEEGKYTVELRKPKRAVETSSDGFTNLENRQGQATQRKRSSNDAEREDLEIVKNYFMYLARLVLEPDFKEILGWPTLGMTDIDFGDKILGVTPVKNFVTLVAIKV